MTPERTLEQDDRSCGIPTIYRLAYQACSNVRDGRKRLPGVWAKPRPLRLGVTVRLASWTLILAVTAVLVPLQMGCGGGNRATLATFAGSYYGHNRGLTITRDGRARESITSGCCHLVIDLRFRLSQPRGTSRSAAATATVTWVRIGKRSMWPKGLPIPRVSETRMFRLRNGVITESLTGTNYCDPSRGGDGKCGA